MRGKVEGMALYSVRGWTGSLEVSDEAQAGQTRWMGSDKGVGLEGNRVILEGEWDQTRGERGRNGEERGRTGGTGSN